MQYWNNLSIRERSFIAVGGVGVILILVYSLYWQPTLNRLEQLRNEVPQKAAELAWMKHEIQKASPWLSGNSNASGNRPILTIIESRAIESKVKNGIQRVQPGNDNTVKMWFQNVIADHWLNFVNKLALEGISVESTTFSRTKNGKINVRVTFVR